MTGAHRFVLVVLVAALHSTQGLRCFSCDSETSDGLCDNSPGTIPYGTVECSDDSDEHCYTIRYEEQMENSIKMTVNRNCCSESADSAVCPADAEDYEQVDRLAQEGYRITYYRCEEDLCNDDTSDDDSEEENYGDGAVIVEGKQDEDYEYPEDDSDGDDEDEEEDDDDDDEEEEEESDEEEEESGTVRAQLVTTTTTSLVVTSSLSLIRLL